MSQAASSFSRVSLAEYLEREATSTDRHEFHDGEILAMSGGTYRHARVATNLTIALGNRLTGHNCQNLDSNMRVATKVSSRYVYPDASVICEEPQFDLADPKQTTILNPKVIIEVLSESTEAYDRGKKFTHYRMISSLEEYVLVSPDLPIVETFLRQPDGTWSLQVFEGVETDVIFRSLNITIRMQEIYANLKFNPPKTEDDAVDDTQKS